MDENLIEDGIEGEAILTCAARVAQTVDNRESYSDIMSLVASRCAGLGLLDVAVRLADTIDDPYSREQALAGIAAECVRFNEADYAEELLEAIDDESLRGVALEEMSVKYAERGDFDLALETAREIDEGGQVLSRIALVYADGGHIQEALDSAQSIEDSGLRANTLIELASRSLRAKRSAEETAQLLVEAQGVVDELEFPEDRINTLVTIASLYKENGQEEQSAETLTRASGLCSKIKGTDNVGMASSYSKDGALAQLASGFAQLQQFDQADLLIEQIEDASQFAVASAEVAIEYQRAGQSEQALNLLNEALEVTTGEEVYGANTQMVLEGVLARLACSFAEVGRYDDALRIAGMVSPTELQPNLPHSTLKEVARACVRNGNHDPIFRAEEMIEEPYAKVLFDLEIGDALDEAGQAEVADRMLSHALTSAETIRLAYEKALALMEVAVRLAKKGEEARASDLLFSALETTVLIGGGYQKARALVRLDDSYRKIGRKPGEREEIVLQETSP